MYLVIAGTKKRSLYNLLWSWASGKPHYRDMRKYLIAKLSGGIYLYKEEERVRQVLYSTQWFQGKENLRVMRVTDMDVDLKKPLTSPAPASNSADAPSPPAQPQSQPEAAHPQTTAPPSSTPQTADRPPPTSMPSRTQPP